MPILICERTASFMSRAESSMSSRAESRDRLDRDDLRCPSTTLGMTMGTLAVTMGTLAVAMGTLAVGV